MALPLAAPRRSIPGPLAGGRVVQPRVGRFTARRALRARVVATALLAACGGPQDGEQGTPAIDTAAPRALDERAMAAASGAAAPADSVAAECAMRGAWRQCSVVERLESAGLGPELLQEGIRQPSLAIPGTAYRLGSAELQLYLYADSAGAARQAAAVDVADASPAAMEGILRPPLVVHSQNLVALLFDNNDRLRERVRLAIMAGLPRG